MNSELIFIIQCFRIYRSIANALCDHVVNEWSLDDTNCSDISCSNCPVRNTLASSSEHFTTQILLTMEAVRYETRNPTPD